MELVIDACSIILLAKATILEDLAKWRSLVVTTTVYNEVIEGKNKGLLDALLLERLKEEKKITVKNILNKELIQKLAQDIGLGAGEAEAIAAALESESKTILTDNKQGRKAAKIYGLNLLGSIEVITVLQKKKKISKEKALGALKILKEKGWFQNYLIEEAMKEVHNA